MVRSVNKLFSLLTFFSSWRSGRWFLLASILMAGFCFLAPDFILKQLVTPSADFTRNGWMLHFSEPSHPVGVDGYTGYLQAEPLVALNPDFIKARGYMVWRIPVDGQYCIQFLAEDYGSLSVDGKTIARVEPDHPVDFRAVKWISLAQGDHLFKVGVQNRTGKGGFTVEVIVPPMMSTRHLAGPDVSVPDIYLPGLWWGILVFCHTGKTVFCIASAFFALCLLLPLTLENRLLSVAVTASIAIVPAAVIPVAVQREPYIGEMINQELRKEDPDFVFIGNSMLWSRIDDAYLGELLGGRKVHSIINFGGLSAVHYLSFKYLFLPANIKPKKVFILFRGTQFSFPRARTSNDPFVERVIERLTPVPDPVFEKIVHGRSRSVTDLIYDELLRFFPVAAARDEVREKFTNLALFMAGHGPPSHPDSAGDGKAFLKKVNQRFSLAGGSLRSGIGIESQQKDNMENPYDFYGRVEDSFLPSMLQLAKEKNISLVFIRVQERPPGNGPVIDPPAMRQYMRDMRKYLEDHGAALYDFTGDPELPLSAYHDGDHIKDQKKYTELFYRRAGAFLK